ncbi:MAG: ABC transporter permease [Deltaproteobacteria bacterium]|nr:ABC transporter permease [Deltaproteobacteria bacterium]
MNRTKLMKFVEISRTSGFDAIRRTFDFMGGSLNLLYSVLISIFKPPFYSKLLLEQCYLLGVRSLSLVFITAASTGMVMSIQFGYGLERFGGKLYVPRVVGLSIMRELGPVLTCLMIAGRVGSGIAAELGSMKVTQQIDAIRALGTDPLKRIIIPRILALFIMTPLLAVLADFVGIYGGMFISYFELNIHPSFYFHQSVVALRLSDFTIGIGKTLVFSLIIGVTGCYYGIKTEGGTQGVGQATTHSVVTSSILITIADFILTKIFWIFERGLNG